ncbi:MAG: kynureninase [Planctomycetia bacterium TMED53]|nr:MAG: kynureninase [Planctomycetia bacterium TMED53]
MTHLEKAQRLENEDPVKSRRDRFHVPRGKNGEELVYFCGNSLGLMPKQVEADLQAELEDWRDLAVDGHHHARRPWFPYHESFRETGARLVGANPGEVVFMNTLTANLHFLMASFYRPNGKKTRILSDAPTFPSDIYALQSQIRWHGGDIDRDMLVLHPKEGASCLEDDDIVAAIHENADEIAMVMLAGVNFLTGQAYDLKAISAACQQHAIPFGVDLAHAAGNLHLKLHEDGVDFAAWCTYKYVNCGPGAVAAAFVHEKHANDKDLVRLAGWWGNDPATRFQMDEMTDFVPHPGAEGWQVSNPPIFSMTPLHASLAIFDEVGIGSLRERSLRMTGFLEECIREIGDDHYSIITPSNPQSRGSQISLRVHENAPALRESLQEAGIVTDFRPPDVIRIAPTPLYNTYEEIARFASVLSERAGVGS